MYKFFIQGIEEYKSKSKASLINPQLIHHHGSAGIERADLLKEIVMRLLLCGYYDHIETILSLKNKKNLILVHRFLSNLSNKLIMILDLLRNIQ